MSKRARRLSRCVKAPIRVLNKAMEMYVRGISGCAGRRTHYGVAVNNPGPRSYSFHATRTGEEDDVRVLIRVASLNRRVGLGGGGRAAVARSRSVVLGRIDEDEPCEFSDDVKVGGNMLFPRSRSCAVTGRSSVGVDRLIA